jgi:oligopeptide/dipeptide ABC transporter ATP-binding protein
VVETGPVRDIFYHSRHPYTRGLLNSLPKIDAPGDVALVPIEGHPPSLAARPSGCPFHPRCVHARELCVAREPELRPVGSLFSACHFAEELGSGSSTGGARAPHLDGAAG